MNGNTKWIMGIIGSIIVVGFSAWLTTIYTGQTRAAENINNLTASVAALNENKLNTQKQFDEVYKRLDKIDSKLDMIINQRKTIQ